MKTDVVVLGAGPVGLTLANELARHGVRPRIVDRAPAIREVSKALILHVRTQEMLDKVGIMPQVLAEARALTEVVVNAYGKFIGSWHLEGIDGPYDHPLILGQNRTQHHLLQHLRTQGVEVEWNTEATEVKLTENLAELKLKRLETGKEEFVQADYVVGCEGSASLVRKSLGLTFEGERYSGEQFIQADCRIRWSMPKGRSHLFLTKDGYMMVIEMPGDTVRVFISIPDQQERSSEKHLAGAIEDSSNQPGLEEIEHHFRRLTGLQVELSEATWLARYRTSHRYTNRFSQGRGFLAGDAAHVHVPIGGQGMNTGIQDAFNLGWKLAGVVAGRYQPWILETYHDERHPVAEGLIHGTDFAYKGLLHPSEVKQRAARLLGPFLIKTSLAQNFMRNTLEELKIAFAHTALNQDLGGSRGPRPGERSLDGDVVRWSDRQTVSLNQLTRSTSWTLLLFSGTLRQDQSEALDALAQVVKIRWSALVTAYQVVASDRPPSLEGADPTLLLMDPYHLLHDQYGVTDAAIYLLRPDCCVGFRGRGSDGDQLLAYLAKVFA